MGTVTKFYTSKKVLTFKYVQHTQGEKANVLPDEKSWSQVYHALPCIASN